MDNVTFTLQRFRPIIERRGNMSFKIKVYLKGKSDVSYVTIFSRSKLRQRASEYWLPKIVNRSSKTTTFKTNVCRTNVPLSSYCIYTEKRCSVGNLIKVILSIAEFYSIAEVDPLLWFHSLGISSFALQSTRKTKVLLKRHRNFVFPI